jgi:hypothetical protein
MKANCRPRSPEPVLDKWAERIHLLGGETAVDYERRRRGTTSVPRERGIRGCGQPFEISVRHFIYNLLYYRYYRA